MHKGKQTKVCSRFTASALTRRDLDTQLVLYGKVIGDGGAGGHCEGARVQPHGDKYLCAASGACVGASM